MKKTNKKLTLNAQTVRNLDSDDLAQVAGGNDTWHHCPQTEYRRPSVCMTNCRASDCVCDPIQA